MRSAWCCPIFSASLAASAKLVCARLLVRDSTSATAAFSCKVRTYHTQMQVYASVHVLHLLMPTAKATMKLMFTWTRRTCFTKNACPLVTTTGHPSKSIKASPCPIAQVIHSMLSIRARSVFKYSVDRHAWTASLDASCFQNPGPYKCFPASVQWFPASKFHAQSAHLQHLACACVAPPPPRLQYSVNY
jgi:hypothetical protein